MSKRERVLAWHFLPADGCLANTTRKRKVITGHTYKVRGPLVLCKHGLHGSERLRDALGYAPGPVLCRVEHLGSIVRGDDKLASSQRKVLFLADCSTLLHEFACDEAERALDACRDAGDTVDPRSREAIRVKRLWLQGKATDAELDAARAADGDAARAADGDAAWSADGAAAWAADGDAAWSADGAAAWAAARAAQNDRLTAAVMTHFRSLGYKGG